MIQFVEQDVGQERRQRPALRRSEVAGLDVLTDQHPGSQVTSDEGQQSLFTDPLGNACHQDVVIDIVERLRQVEIDRHAMAGLDVGLYERDVSVHKRCISLVRRIRWAWSRGANSPADQAFYAVSVRRLARFLSSFLRTIPRRLALAFG